jgi:predicted nucleic acid-binding Zn ribbon protein
MIKVYDFVCTNGHQFEEFVFKDIATSRCGCGADARRVLSAPAFHLDGSSGHFPGAASKWEREHERLAKTGDS